MRRALGCLAITALLVSACAAEPTPPPMPSGTLAESPSPEATLAPTSVPSLTAEPSPSASPEPPLSLDLPTESDARIVNVSVAPEVAADGDGEILVTVTSAADERIDELVLRWPTELNDTLFLAPFSPTDDRIREGGPPLVQAWTKWVIGPGEQDEPDGTVSLGYGPLLDGATLEIRLFVTRNAPGPVAFDLQVLSKNNVLTLDDGEPAEIRVEVP
ncbi:MAG: hypothetical protein H0X68_05055 [Chloroflexi bacterium]|nr:hypothetical protein [Chloroflexota bacterium]